MLVPFIIIPILVSNQFSDSTLLIRRSALFIILPLILLFFNFKKVTINKVESSQIKWMFLFFSFILYSLISSYFSALNFNESFWGIIYLIGWLSISTTIILYANQSIMNKILMITSYIGGMLSLFALLQAYGLFEIENFSSTSATFINRNFWGMYLCFVIPATVYSSIISINKNRLIHLLMFTFSICSLLHNRSRAAWAGIFIAFLLLILIYNKSILTWVKSYYNKKNIYSIAGLIVGIILIFIYTEPEVENVPNYKKTIWSTLTTSNKNILTETEGYTNTLGERIPLYSSTLNMIQDYWIIGVGYNNWRLKHPFYYGEYIHDENYLKLNQRPHNDILWIISEGGLIGLILFMTIVLLPTIFTLKNILLKPNDKDQLLNSFLLISIVCILIESLFDFPKQRTVPNLYIWSFLGYLTIHIPSQNNINQYFSSIMKNTLLTIAIVISIFGYMDYKSNQFSRKMLILKSQKEYDQAIINGKKALQYGKSVDNTGTPITFYLGVLEYQKGNVINSDKYFKKALEIHPHHLGTLENQMIIKAKSNNFNEALEIMNYLRTLYPKYYSPVLKMTKLYLQQNNLEKANLLIEVTNFDNATQKVKKTVENLKNYIILQSRQD